MHVVYSFSFEDVCSVMVGASLARNKSANNPSRPKEASARRFYAKRKRIWFVTRRENLKTSWILDVLISERVVVKKYERYGDEKNHKQILVIVLCLDWR